MFKFVRNFQNVFQCSSSGLHSYQQCHWPLMLSASFILVILVAVKWCLILLSICIFLMVNDVEVFPCAYWSFIYLLCGVFANILPIFNSFLSSELDYISFFNILCISPLCVWERYIYIERRRYIYRERKGGRGSISSNSVVLFLFSK